MTGRDMLVQQFGAIYAVIARNIDGLTHDHSLAPAAGGGNTANWILGHVVNVQNAVMQIIGAPPVWESEQLELARFDHPIRAADEAIDWPTLVERFNASRDSCLAALAELSDVALADKMPDPFGKRPPGQGCSVCWPSISAITLASSAWRGVRPERRRRSSHPARPRRSEIIPDLRCARGLRPSDRSGDRAAL